MDAMVPPFDLPPAVLQLLCRLNRAGYEAYLVGGCVRDLLSGKTPHDWDICTSALPGEVAACLPDLRVVGTGLAHGTVTAVAEGKAYEITTFRTEGVYSDGRRPDSVQFVQELSADLSRRDFTVNAMAYHPATGLVDLFGGRQDLAAGVLCCVGEPDARFAEDHLRLLRALRFASCLGLSLSADTAAAVHRQAALLGTVASERIFAELRRLICGPWTEPVLTDYADVLFVILPELSPMQGFEQHNPHHLLTVWQHTLRAVRFCPPQETVRLAALFHDAGKPACFSCGADGIGHFYGHAVAGEQIARAALHRLRAPRALTEDVCRLVAVHDMVPLTTATFARRRLAQLGQTQYRRLLSLWRADVLAQSLQEQPARLAVLDLADARLAQILAEPPCFSVTDLAVRGGDLLAAGIPQGPAVGQILRALLGQVMAGTLQNERGALLAAAAREYDPLARS